jgi:hypothetical protein
LLSLGATIALVLVAGGIVTAETSETRMSRAAMTASVDARLRVPNVDYRRHWVQLGSYSVLADEPTKGAKELHVVYAHPASVFVAKTEGLTTGTASYANVLLGRFVMVKDTGNKHAANSPLWGDGWGWAFYEGEEMRKTVTTDYQVDCLGCHEPARDTDLLYTQGYPVLKSR